MDLSSKSFPDLTGRELSDCEFLARALGIVVKQHPTTGLKIRCVE